MRRDRLWRRRSHVCLFAMGHVCLFSQLAFLTPASFYKQALFFHSCLLIRGRQLLRSAMVSTNSAVLMSRSPYVIMLAEIGHRSLTIEDFSIEDQCNFTILHGWIWLLQRSLLYCFISLCTVKRYMYVHCQFGYSGTRVHTRPWVVVVWPMRWLISLYKGKVVLSV